MGVKQGFEGHRQQPGVAGQVRGGFWCSVIWLTNTIGWTKGLEARIQGRIHGSGADLGADQEANPGAARHKLRKKWVFIFIF